MRPGRPVGLTRSPRLAAAAAGGTDFAARARANRALDYTSTGEGEVSRAHQGIPRAAAERRSDCVRMLRKIGPYTTLLPGWLVVAALGCLHFAGGFGGIAASAAFRG